MPLIKAECRGAEPIVDIDVVKIGALTTVRLTSFSQCIQPVDGELIRISADIVNALPQRRITSAKSCLTERLAQQRIWS